MVYHSSLNELPDVQQVCGCSMLPIVTTTRGPAPLAPEGQEDIIDEVLGFFKANVLFKHFEVKGGADRVLIYLTLYITQCLQRLEKCPTPQEGIKALTAMACESFKIPGDVGFALGSFFPPPATPQEAGTKTHCVLPHSLHSPLLIANNSPSCATTCCSCHRALSRLPEAATGGDGTAACGQGVWG